MRKPRDGPASARLALPLLVLATGGRLGAAVLQTPASAAELYATKGLKEITTVAEDAYAARAPQISAGLPAAKAKATAAFQAEVAATRQAVAGEKAGEAATADGMRKTVIAAHTAGIPLVESSAREFARLQANVDAYKAMQPSMQHALDSDTHSEGVRRDALQAVQVAANVATEMVELAQEAKLVAQQLIAAQPEAHGKRFQEHNAAALSQVELSRRMADFASKAIRDADRIAVDALKKAKDAEATANEALSNARENAGKLQKLKLRAEKAVQRAKGQVA